MQTFITKSITQVLITVEYIRESVEEYPHLVARLITPITQANRIPLSNQDSEFISTIAPTPPNKAVQSKNCRNTWEIQGEDSFRRVTVDC